MQNLSEENPRDDSNSSYHGMSSELAQTTAEMDSTSVTTNILQRVVSPPRAWLGWTFVVHSSNIRRPINNIKTIVEVEKNVTYVSNSKESLYI